MRWRRAVVLLFCLANACAPHAVRPKSLSLCRGQSCETVSDAASRLRLLTVLHGLLREAKGGEIRVFSSSAQNRAKRKAGISFYTQGGPLPGLSTITALDVRDVLFLDRDASEIKSRLKTSAYFVGVPLICTESAATLSIGPDQASLEFSNICSWVGIGNTKTRFQLFIDRVDADEGTASGNWSVRTAGLPVLGGGSGYLVARFRPAPTAVSIPARQPSTPSPPPAVLQPAPEKPVEVVSESIELEMTTRLSEESGDRVLQANEEVSLQVTAVNKGQALASNTQLSLSGDPLLIACFGSRKPLGAIAPGGQAGAQLKCRMPAQLPTQTAELMIELQAGPKETTASAKRLRVGMKGAAIDFAEEVISEVSVDDIPPRSARSRGGRNIALVIGLSRYREKSIPAVKYAARDAEVIARYLQNIAGVPNENLKILVDDSATKSDLEAYFEDWLPRRAKADSTVFVYYAGHGAPDETGGEAFLVPYEGQPDFPSKLFPLKRMHEALAKLPSKVVVMLDSCFSGAKGRGIAKEGARPLLSVSLERPDPAGGRVSVLAGATGSQIASDLDSAEHGLFTYYLLKGLRGEADADHDGSVSLGELYAFARDGVSRKASETLNRDQTPVFLGDMAASAKLPLSQP